MTPCPVAELKQKSAAMPVSGTCWGLPGALSARARIAVLVGSLPHVAACAGLNAICTVQLPPGGTGPATQEPFELLARTKSPLFVPVTVTVLNWSDPPGGAAELVTVTGCEGPAVPASCEPKLTLAGKETEGGAVADPDKEICWRLPAALSEIASAADRFPGGCAGTGANATLMVHCWPGLSAEPSGQLFVCLKSPGFAPIMEILPIASGAAPTFKTVRLCGALAVPSACAPNGCRLEGEIYTDGTGVAVPWSGTV